MEVVVVDGTVEKPAASAPSKRVLPFRSPASLPPASSSVSRAKSPARNVKQGQEEKEEEVTKNVFVPKKWQGGGGGGQERGGAALGALSASELPNGAKNCLEVT